MFDHFLWAFLVDIDFGLLNDDVHCWFALWWVHMFCFRGCIVIANKRAQISGFQTLYLSKMDIEFLSLFWRIQTGIWNSHFWLSCPFECRTLIFISFGIWNLLTRISIKIARTRFNFYFFGDHNFNNSLIRFFLVCQISCIFSHTCQGTWTSSSTQVISAGKSEQKSVFAEVFF